MLALVPWGANTWFERLPFKDLPVYLCLVAEVNPVAMNMAEMIADRVLSLWRREEAPERLLRVEHLETVDEVSFKANPSKLFEEINVGCTTRGTHGPDRIQARRAVTIPADVDGNDAAALDAVFLSKVRLPQGVDEYEVLPGFFDGVDLSGASARVGGAAAVAREALSGVTGSGDCESTTSMPSKGVQCAL
jgi:hypothetical protein